ERDAEMHVLPLTPASRKFFACGPKQVAIFDAAVTRGVHVCHASKNYWGILTIRAHGLMLPAESSTFTKVLTLQSVRRLRIGPIRRKSLRIKEAEKYDHGNAARHQRGDVGCRPSAPGGSGGCAGA